MPVPALIRANMKSQSLDRRVWTTPSMSVLFSRVAVGSPVNGMVEIAGPQQFRLDQFIRRGLDARHDPRAVIADPHACYFGAELGECTLVPGDNAIPAETCFEDWLSQSMVATPQTP